MLVYIGSTGRADWYYGEGEITDLFYGATEGGEDDEYDKLIIFAKEPYIGSEIDATYYFNSLNYKYVSANGGGGEGEDSMVVHSVNGALDKTWSEIKHALGEGKHVCYVDNTDNYGSQSIITFAGKDANSMYQVYAISCSSIGTILYNSWTATEADGYPRIII